MNESEFQDGVIDMAQRLGWRVAHFRPARTATGWATAVAADGQGYPDLTMVNGPRLVFAELKGERGRLGPGQDDWLQALAATRAEVYLWRPSDWDEVMRVLSGGRG